MAQAAFHAIGPECKTKKYVKLLSYWNAPNLRNSAR